MRFFFSFVLLAALAAAQVRLTVDQLRTLIRSSVQLKHEDRRVADSLKRVQMAERLEDADVEELLGFGAGPRTIDALKALSTASVSLPPPGPRVPQNPAPVATIPPPSEEEKNDVLGAAREYALNYTRSLPDFLCVQVTRRYLDPSGLEFWQRQDVITERLSFSEGREKYDVVLVNGSPVMNISHEQLGGTTSSGEFGTLLKEVFDPETGTEFSWERWATLRGQRTHVYAFRVLQSRSKYSIRVGNQAPIIAGYRGLVYVERSSRQVTRLVLQTEGLPPTFPIQEVRSDLNYDYAEIAGRKFLLPLKAEVRAREGKLLTRNEVEFRSYRKFGTETSITFEPEPLPDEVTKEQPEAAKPKPPAVKKK